MKLVDDSIYEPLRDHLLFSGKNSLTMSFAEIEGVLGRPLPASARKRKAWWSNNARGHVQADAWLRSSYKTSDLDLGAQRVTFLLKYETGFSDAKQAVYAAAGLAPPKEVAPGPGK